MRRRNERNKTKTDMGLCVAGREKAVDASCVLERAGERERERESKSGKVLCISKYDPGELKPHLSGNLCVFLLPGLKKLSQFWLAG